MRFTVEALRERGVPDERIYLSMERNMKCAVGLCGHCQFGPTFVCKDGPVSPLRPRRRAAGGAGDLMARKPKLAVWKFASCDGCQLTLLDCEDELLAVAGEVEIAYFLEATSARRRRARTTSRSSKARSPRRTTPSASSEVRARSRGALVTIGACATAGGIQALRNFADVEGVHARRLRDARVHRDARDLDADRRPRAGRLRAARLPDRQAPARSR